MKRVFTSSLAALCAIAGMAQTITVDDINYIVNEGTRTVTVDGFVSGAKVPDALVIPSTIESDGESYTVTQLGIAAFYGRRIKSLTLPETVTVLGEHSLEGTLMTDFTVPSGVKELPLSVLANNTKLTHVTLPSGLTRIGAGAFTDCDALEYIEIPESVTSFGIAAFSNCSSMQYVNYLGTLLTWYAIDFDAPSANPLYSAHVWKVKGQTPPAISVPSKVGEVKKNAFAGCTSLVSVEVMEDITSIGENAFSGCSGLTSMTFCSALENVGEWAFQDCTSLKKVYTISLTDFLNTNFNGWYSNPMSNGADLYIAENGRFTTPATSLIIPEEITEIRPFALNGCSSIDNVTLHEGVTSIGEGAFKECSALKEIVLPASVSTVGNEAFAKCVALEKVGLGDGVMSVGAQAFQDCPAMTELQLSGNMVDIPEYMCAACSSLSSLVIPDNVANIGTGAFINCSALADVTFGEGIETIGTQAFSSNALTEVNIPGASLSDIGPMAFYDCMSLNKVTLGPGLTSVGDQAFYRCMALRDVTCMGSRPASATTNMCLGSTFANAILHVPASAVDSYATATGWNLFANIAPISVTGVEDTEMNAEAGWKYYRLDGTTVARPSAHGLYIRVNGERVEKVAM